MKNEINYTSKNVRKTRSTVAWLAADPHVCPAFQIFLSEDMLSDFLCVDIMWSSEKRKWVHGLFFWCLVCVKLPMREIKCVNNSDDTPETSTTMFKFECGAVQSRESIPATRYVVSDERVKQCDWWWVSDIWEIGWHRTKNEAMKKPFYDPKW